MRISAIMTARGAAATIRIAVVSTLVALSRDDELLVFLDECDGSSLAALGGIRDPRLSIIENSGNSIGAAAGRNRLIELATGDLIAVIDADDICLPWRFSVARRKIGSDDAIFSTALILRVNRRFSVLLPQLFRSISPRNVPLELLHRNPFVHSSFVVRSSAIRGVGGYQQGSLLEDLDLYLRLVIDGKSLRRLAFPSVIYRQHPAQISRSFAVMDAERKSPRIDLLRQKLSESLGWGIMSREEIMRRARALCSHGGIFVRLEILGLSNVFSLARARNRNTP